MLKEVVWKFRESMMPHQGPRAPVVLGEELAELCGALCGGVVRCAVVVVWWCAVW